MSRFPLLLIALLLAGCVGSDDPQRIHVRRTPEIIARDDASPKNYAQLREELKQQDEANALTGELKRSEGYLKVKRYKIGLITRAPRDPWADYEGDRRRALYRHFGDRFSAPPVFAGEPLPGEEPPPATDADGDDGDGETPGTDDADDYGY
ncbi:MAG: hypothetical protein JKY65_26910 [Planctomycetes bacterium]|nr:hypothetical protein [Planctomycetota bacterium]